MSEKSRAGCEGKVRFETYELAARARNGRRKGNLRRRQVYHCPHCHGFHLGARKDVERRRPRRLDEDLAA